MQVRRDGLQVRDGGLADLGSVSGDRAAAPAAAVFRGSARSGVGPRPNRPMRHRLIAVASLSSSTATAAPATAKSPGRRANSSIANPRPRPAAGKVTPVSSSSGSSAVLQMPVKNPAAGMVRWPRGDSAVDGRVKRQGHRRVLGGGVGVRE